MIRIILALLIAAPAYAQVGPIPYSALGKPGGPPKLDSGGRLNVLGDAIDPTAIYRGIYPGVTFIDQNVTSFLVPGGYAANQKTGFAAYFSNLAATSGGGHNAVGFFTAGTAGADNAASWGINTLLQDSATRAVGTGTGRILVNEFDFNVMSPGTQVIGLSIGGNSLAQPAVSNGFVVNPLGTGIQWGGAFVSEDAATSYGLVLGTTATSNNSGSQTIILRSRDGGGTNRNTALSASPAGALSISAVAVNIGPSAAPMPFTLQSTDLVVQNSSVTAASLYTYLYGHDGMSSTLAIEPGSTVIQANAVSGLIRNRNPTGSVGVGLNFFGTAEVDGARTWGTAGVLQDYPSVGTDTGGGTGRLLQNEWDFRVKHAGSQVVGLVLTMDVQAGGTQPTNADGFVAGATPGSRWVNAFRSYDNESQQFATVGMVGGTAGAANLSSQPIVFTGTDGAGALLTAQLVYSGPTKTLQLSSPGSVPANFFVTNLISSGGFQTIDGAVGTWIGTAAAGNNTSSQTLTFSARNTAGTAANVTMTADPNGNMAIIAPGTVVSFIDGSGTSMFSVVGSLTRAKNMQATGTILMTGLPTCASAPASGNVCRDTTTTPATLKVIP